MFLLLQLLDHRVIGMQRETLGCGTGVSANETSSMMPRRMRRIISSPMTEGKACGHKHQHHAQHDGIGQQPHSNPQYQRRKLLP